jgi:hypothetical protein
MVALQVTEGTKEVAQKTGRALNAAASSVGQQVRALLPHAPQALCTCGSSTSVLPIRRCRRHSMCARLLAAPHTPPPPHTHTHTHTPPPPPPPTHPHHIAHTLYMQAIEIDHRLRLSERATAAGTAIKESAVGRSAGAALGRIGSAVGAGTKKVLENDKVGRRGRGGWCQAGEQGCTAMQAEGRMGSPRAGWELRYRALGAGRQVPAWRLETAGGPRLPPA